LGPQKRTTWAGSGPWAVGWRPLLYKVCKRFRNVRILDISNISSACHTRHGQRLNRIGKEYVSQEISKIIGNIRKKHPNAIALGDSNQGN
jgi:hypothetical protein